MFRYVRRILDGFHNCSGVTSAYRAHDCLDGWNRRAENEEWKSGNNDVNPIISELVENILPPVTAWLSSP